MTSRSQEKDRQDKQTRQARRIGRLNRKMKQKCGQIDGPKESVIHRQARWTALQTGKRERTRDNWQVNYRQQMHAETK